jgi:tetratricopeptide (TPR) repeat protein
VRAGAFVVAGRSALEAGEPERAQPWLEKGLELARESGDELRTAWALHGLGHALAEEGEPERARSLLEESMELFLRLGEHAPAGGRMTFLAYYAYRDGDLERAQSLLEDATEQYRLAGDETGVGGCIHSLGDLELARGNYAEALERFREAQPLLVRSGSPFDLAYMAAAVAAVAAQAGRRDTAGRLWGAFERLHAESERVLEAEIYALYKRTVGVVDADAVEAGRALSEDDAVTLAQRVADDLAASRRPRLARTAGHSSSSTE